MPEAYPTEHATEEPAAYRVQCCESLDIEIQQLPRLAARHLSAMERELVIPVLSRAVSELAALDCLLEVPAGIAQHDDPLREPCIVLLDAYPLNTAQGILERAAQEIYSNDPEKTTLESYRALLGLPERSHGRQLMRARQSTH